MTIAEGRALAERIEAEGYRVRGLKILSNVTPSRCHLSVAGRVTLRRPDDWNEAARGRAIRR